MKFFLMLLITFVLTNNLLAKEWDLYTVNSTETIYLKYNKKRFTAYYVIESQKDSLYLYGVVKLKGRVIFNKKDKIWQLESKIKSNDLSSNFLSIKYVVFDQNINLSFSHNFEKLYLNENQIFFKNKINAIELRHVKNKLSQFSTTR